MIQLTRQGATRSSQLNAFRRSRVLFFHAFFLGRVRKRWPRRLFFIRTFRRKFKFRGSCKWVQIVLRLFFLRVVRRIGKELVDLCNELVFGAPGSDTFEHFVYKMPRETACVNWFLLSAVLVCTLGVFMQQFTVSLLFGSLYAWYFVNDFDDEPDLVPGMTIGRGLKGGTQEEDLLKGLQQLLASFQPAQPYPSKSSDAPSDTMQPSPTAGPSAPQGKKTREVRKGKKEPQNLF